jgi:hypothetical protein
MPRPRPTGWMWLGIAAVGVLVTQPSPGRTQGFPPPAAQENLQRVEDLESACSGGFGPADSDCLTAVQIALGKRPMIEETRLPDGGFRHVSKMGTPEPAKAAWLMEQACAHKLWETCMTYSLILDRGIDGIPQDRARSEALTQAACSDHHSAACESLTQDKIAIVPNSTIPPVPAWITPPTPRPRTAPTLPSTTAQQPALPRMSPTPPPGLDDPLFPGDDMEGDIFTRCRAGSGSDCYRLALFYRDLPSTPDRINHYYEKACDLGHGPACTKLGRAPSVRGNRGAMGLYLLLGIAGIITAGTILIVVMAKRR